jgi:hypothetical protein
MGKAHEHRERRRVAFAEQGGLCWWCRRPMVWIEKPQPHEHPPRMCTLEHLRTRAHPGRLEPAKGQKRRVAACYECNHTRADGRCWTPPQVSSTTCESPP